MSSVDQNSINSFRCHEIEIKSIEDYPYDCSHSKAMFRSTGSQYARGMAMDLLKVKNKYHWVHVPLGCRGLGLCVCVCEKSRGYPQHAELPWRIENDGNNGLCVYAATTTSKAPTPPTSRPHTCTFLCVSSVLAHIKNLALFLLLTHRSVFVCVYVSLLTFRNVERACLWTGKKLTRIELSSVFTLLGMSAF